MKFIRDINTVGKRERIAAGITSTIVGGALIVAQDLSEGGSLEGSIIRVMIAVSLGIGVCIVYNRLQKRKEREHLKEEASDIA